nr:transposase [Pseudoleptotrichia goodfellowii]
MKLKTDIENNVENEKRVEDYRKYFDIKVEKENIIAVAKDDIIEKHMKKYGYFSLISNENLEAREILSIYRQKDVAEKAFHNIKDRLDARRLRVSSKPTMDGKIFVTFVSLVMLSYIKNKMSEKELYKKYTTQELLDELDLIESYERGNEKLKLGEVTKKQKEIFKYMDIKFPEELL